MGKKSNRTRLSDYFETGIQPDLWQARLDPTNGFIRPMDEMFQPHSFVNICVMTVEGFEILRFPAIFWGRVVVIPRIPNSFHPEKHPKHTQNKKSVKLCSPHAVPRIYTARHVVCFTSFRLCRIWLVMPRSSASLGGVFKFLYCASGYSIEWYIF